MKVKSVEITEQNGKSTIKINGKELQGVTCFELKKISANVAELMVCLDVIPDKSDCGFETEIEDYKEAFEQLMEQYQVQVKESNKTILTFSNSLQDSRRMCKILAVTTMITSVLLILALLK